MLNTSIAGTSVTRHRSSRQLTKERGVNGIIADNKNIFLKVICLHWFFGI